MKIGLLESDHVSEKYLSISGTYPQMFAKLLPEVEIISFDVLNGQFPKSVDDCEAYICTGSKYSVYEDIDWIKQLKDFVFQLYKKEKKFVGVCFGHQMLAEALGGKVLKSGKGWNVGVHPFGIAIKEEWMDPFQETFDLIMMCQDQVVELPDNSKLLAHADDCFVGMFKVGDTMLGIQAHPEFSKEYEKALMLDRIDRIGEEKVQKAIKSFEKSPDQGLIGRWIVKFLSL
jgi:GMP synthase-like glutamine amidotransferase